MSSFLSSSMSRASGPGLSPVLTSAGSLNHEQRLFVITGNFVFKARARVHGEAGRGRAPILTRERSTPGERGPKIKVSRIENYECKRTELVTTYELTTAGWVHLSAPSLSVRRSKSSINE